MRPALLQANSGQDGEAEQEVRTPRAIIDRIVASAFGGLPVALDPCAPTKSPPSFYASRYVREAENGLLVPWVDRTFVNPPFADLVPWLERARRFGAALGPPPRIVLLVPFRSHRGWFQEALASATSATLLRGVRFVGHSSAFPAPVALISWNCTVDGPVIIRAQKGSPL